MILHDNGNSKRMKAYLESLKWEVLTHPPYSLDIALSDYHLFRSMAHTLAEQHFPSDKHAKISVDSKDVSFFRRGISMLSERWENVVARDGQYFQ